VRSGKRQVQVADRDGVFAWADRVVDDHGRANLVVNNAGVALLTTVLHASADEKSP